MSQVIYRFSNFVVEADTRSLLRDGMRVQLQDQPFQVLLALLEQPGQVVSRDTLRLRLWGRNVFVDFDQSLNSALRRLRMALRDSPRRPVHIETLPRLGFRFLSAVTVENAPRHLPLPLLPGTRSDETLSAQSRSLASLPLQVAGG